MGFVERHVRKRPGQPDLVTWRARWVDPDGRERSRSHRRKVDADRFAAEVGADLLRGIYVDPSAGRESLRAYVEYRWLASQVHLAPNTLTLYRSHLRTHLLPALGARPVGALRRTDAKSLVGQLTATLAPNTVHTVFAVLRVVLQSAVDDGLIAANPCTRVPLPRVERLDVEPLPPDAVLALAAALPPRYEVTAWLGVGAGLRQGESLGMLPGRVDFLRRRVHVEAQLQGPDGGEPALCPLKTRASRRVVPVDDVVLEAVARHMERWAPGPGGLLVTNRLGRPVRRSSFGDCWRKAVRDSGAPKGTRFHDLRHFYASTLIRAGLHPKAIQARLGHASITETMDTYGHLFPDAEESGRGALDAMLRAATDPGRTREHRR